MSNVLAKNILGALVVTCLTPTADAELTLVTQFNPDDVGAIVSLAHDTN